MSFKNRLHTGEFIVLAEMNTPKGIDISRFITDIRRVKDRVAAIWVPDMENGVMRMSALAGGALVQQHGIDALVSVYGRDRNRLALQADLLAAQVLGVQNLVVTHGEDMAQSDHRNAKPVDDLDELALLDTIAGLQDGKDLSGFDLDGKPEFTVGCTMAAWPDEAALDKEVEQVQRKKDAGAQFVVTPPVFDTDRFARDLEKIKGLDMPVISTVFLIKSVAVARYIATNEPQARISEDLIRRIRKASDRELEVLKIAGETVSALQGLVQGALLQTMGWEHRLATILDYAGQ